MRRREPSGSLQELLLITFTFMQVAQSLACVSLGHQEEEL